MWCSNHNPRNTHHQPHHKDDVATLFRIWATLRLREYIAKGFALDDERLKEAGGGNYFDELLARIRILKERILEPLDWVCPISKKR